MIRPAANAAVYRLTPTVPVSASMRTSAKWRRNCIATPFGFADLFCFAMTDDVGGSNRSCRQLLFQILRRPRDGRAHAGRCAQVPAVEIEVTCSDIKEHQHRVENRISDIARSRPLTWQDVVSRDYRPWNRDRIVIDTASRTVMEIVTILRGAIAKQ